MDRKLSRKWWVWALHGGDAVYFLTVPSRSTAVAAEVIGDPYQTDRDTTDPTLLAGDIKTEAADARQAARANRAR